MIEDIMNIFVVTSCQSFVKRKFTVVKVSSFLDLLFTVVQVIVCCLGSVGNATFGS